MSKARAKSDGFKVPVRFVQALLLLTVTLNSCGFHPRGSVVRLTDMGSIFVDSERDLSIGESVKTALAEAAFTRPRASASSRCKAMAV